MKIKFNWSVVFILIFLNAMVGFGFIQLLIAGGIVIDPDGYGGSVTMYLVFGPLFIILGVGGNIMATRSFIESNTIVVDLEDLRKAELRQEMEKLFNEFMKENFKP